MAEGTPPNILVVDDTEAICSALRDILTMNGYTVRTAPSGERALQILEKTKADLIITDLKMGGMSGIDLLKKVKKQMPALPVIILTGFGDMDSVIEAMRSGVADYLKKPFSVNEVLEVVKRELRKAEFAAPAPAPTTGGGPVQAAVGGAPTEPPPRLYIFSPTDLAAVEKSLSELRAQITAESVLLLEEAGYVIAAKGTFKESELPSLATLVVSGRSATAQLARLLGEEQTFALNYLEGQQLSVYTAGLGQALFLVLVVPKHVKQGAVWLYAKKAASEIEKLAGRALRKVAETKAEPVGPSKQELRKDLAQKTDNVFGKELPETAAPAKPVKTLTFEQAMSQGLMGDMVKMMSQSPVEPAAPVSMPEPAPPGPVEVMSFEEAMKQGLLGNLGGLPPAAPAPAEPPTEIMSFEEAMRLGLLGNLGGTSESPKPAPAPAAAPTETMSFEEAMKQGLLGNFGPPPAPPAPEPAADKPAEPTEFLTFEEMLERGLLGSVGSA
jgi:DNA-binding response OmpR family regulator